MMVGGTAVERAEIDAVTCGKSIASFCRQLGYHHSISGIGCNSTDVKVKYIIDWNQVYLQDIQYTKSLADEQCGGIRVHQPSTCH